MKELAADPVGPRQTNKQTLDNYTILTTLGVNIKKKKICIYVSRAAQPSITFRRVHKRLKLLSPLLASVYYFTISDEIPLLLSFSLFFFLPSQPSACQFCRYYNRGKIMTVISRTHQVPIKNLSSVLEDDNYWLYYHYHCRGSKRQILKHFSPK